MSFAPVGAPDPADLAVPSQTSSGLGLFVTALSAGLDSVVKAAVWRVSILKMTGNLYTDVILGVDPVLTVVLLSSTDAIRLRQIAIREKSAVKPHLKVALITTDVQASEVTGPRFIEPIRMARKAGYLPIVCPQGPGVLNATVESVLMALIALPILKSVPCTDFLDGSFVLSSSNSEYGIATRHPGETMFCALRAAIAPVPSLRGLLGTYWTENPDLEEFDEAYECLENIGTDEGRARLLWRSIPKAWANDIEPHACVIRLFPPVAKQDLIESYARGAICFGRSGATEAPSS